MNKDSFIRKDTARHYREIHRILIQGRSEPTSDDMASEIYWMKPTSLLSKIAFALLITGLVIIGSCSVAHAYTDEQAIKTIVGESSNQGFKGMVCVGEVLRRHSRLKGFYGFKASHSIHESKLVWEMARKAWYASKSTNYTKHADHFENLKLDTPYWVKNCVLTFRYKDHAFFREVKRA